MVFLFWLLIGSDLNSIHQIKPLYSFNDELELDSGLYIDEPLDILILANRTYIVGGFEQVLVFENKKFSFSFGKRGEGPKEYKHFLEKIELLNGHIVVTENYGWNRLFFKPDGTFIKKEKLDKSYLYIGNQRFKKINHDLNQDILFRLQKDANCFLGKMFSSEDLDYHKSNFLFLMNESGQAFFIRKFGLIESFDGLCHKKGEIQLEVGDLMRDPVPDPMLTSAYKQLRNSTRKYLFFSNPIFDAALDPTQGSQEIWLLASNEWKMSPRRHPTEVWLMVANMKTGETSRTKLDIPYDKVRVFGDLIALVSTKNALVNVYQRKDLLP